MQAAVTIFYGVILQKVQKFQGVFSSAKHTFFNFQSFAKPWHEAWDDSTCFSFIHNNLARFLIRKLFGATLEPFLKNRPWSNWVFARKTKFRKRLKFWFLQFPKACWQCWHLKSFVSVYTTQEKALLSCSTRGHKCKFLRACCSPLPGLPMPGSWCASSDWIIKSAKRFSLLI